MDYQKMHAIIEDVLHGKKDTAFDDLRAKVHCMGAPRVYGIINAVVSAMEPGEIYLEVGTYQGGSLIAALRDNQSIAVGVDSFTEFQTTNGFERTKKNIQDFGIADRVTFENMPFAQFFAQVAPGFVAQVYYYDGGHDYETQLAGMEAGWPYLRPGSIVLVDDYSYTEVARAINQFVENHKNNLRFEFVMSSPRDMDALWWNGAVVMRVT